MILEGNPVAEKVLAEVRTGVARLQATVLERLGYNAENVVNRAVALRERVS